jgi:hypothetical protein
VADDEFFMGLAEALDAHCSRLGPVGIVDHELFMMQWPKIHACIHDATPDRPWVTIRTEGMASEALDAPPGLDRLELMLYWPGKTHADVPRWATYLLRVAAHIPHDCSSHFAVYDTVLLTDPEDPFPDTKLVGGILRPPALEPDEWHTMPHRASSVTFLELVLLTMDELDFKLEHGGAALAERLVAEGLDPVTDPNRTSLIL